MKIKKLLPFIFGLLIFLYLAYKIGVSSLLETLMNLGYLSIIIILLHFLFQVFFSSLNIKILCKALSKKINYMYLLKSYFNAWGLGKFMPGGIGELSIIFPLKKAGINNGDAIFIATFDKILTLITYIFICSVGIWFFFLFYQSIKLILLFVLIILIILSVFMSNNVRTLIKKYILRKYSSNFKGFSRNFRYLLIKRKKYLVLNLIITFTKSLFSAITPLILFYLLGIQVNLITILFINTFLVLISMVPITIAGLGTKEAFAIYLFSLLNIDAPTAFGVYVSIRIVLISIAGIIILNYLCKDMIKMKAGS